MKNRIVITVELPSGQAYASYLTVPSDDRTVKDFIERFSRHLLIQYEEQKELCETKI